MEITIKTHTNREIKVKNIKQLSHTKDNMVIFLPYCGTVEIEVDGETILNSEMPSFDTRIVKSMDIEL